MEDDSSTGHSLDAAVFLTERKKSHGGKTADKVDDVGEDVAKDAILEMAALDKQLEKIELECSKSSANMDVGSLGDASRPSSERISELEQKQSNHDLDGSLKFNGTSSARVGFPAADTNTDIDRIDSHQGVSPATGPAVSNNSNPIDCLSNGKGGDKYELREKVQKEKSPLYKGDTNGNFPLLEFPVTIDIKHIVPTSDMSCLSVNDTSTHGSVQSSIEQNKSLCRAERNSLLTVEEEERISKMLLQEDEDVEKYAHMPSVEEEREAELDSILLGLGYDIDADDGLAKSNNEDGGADEKGDPVLRELAKQREKMQHEKKIDQALRALLQEPLPPVTRFPKEGAEGYEDSANVSRLTFSCSETVSTNHTTEEDIQTLVQTVKKELEEDEMELADHDSVRMLAQTIMVEESSKKSSLSMA